MTHPLHGNSPLQCTQQKFHHCLPLVFHLLQRLQRPPFHRVVLVLGMVEDKVAFVVHSELRVTLKGENVAADAETLVTAEVAGGEGDGTFPAVALPGRGG